MVRSVSATVTVSGNGLSVPRNIPDMVLKWESKEQSLELSVPGYISRNDSIEQYTRCLSLVNEESRFSKLLKSTVFTTAVGSQERIHTLGHGIQEGEVEDGRLSSANYGSCIPAGNM